MEYSRQLIIETERLWVKPLSYKQLVDYIKLDNVLEDSLGLAHHSRTLPGELKEAFEQTILPHVAAAGNDILYSTLWTIIDKQKKIMVGDLCFKGVPDAAGSIEIGYGTYDAFQGKGLMTEAIGGIIKWAFEQPGVKTILAETDTDNIASHKTLSKNNFTIFKQVENMTWWRLDKNVQ
jgi:RimJ/RimL family protein N-acetyltransferase